MKTVVVPPHIFNGLQEADKACKRKHAKMYRRAWSRGMSSIKGGAAKRWAWLASEF